MPADAAAQMQCSPHAGVQLEACCTHLDDLAADDSPAVQVACLPAMMLGCHAELAVTPLESDLADAGCGCCAQQALLAGLLCLYTVPAEMQHEGGYWGANQAADDCLAAEEAYSSGIGIQSGLAGLERLCLVWHCQKLSPAEEQSAPLHVCVARVPGNACV